MTINPKDDEAFIIMQGKSYLRGVYAGGKVARWSWSVWDAASFKSRTLAESVQEKHGGQIMKCNMRTGEVWNT